MGTIHHLLTVKAQHHPHAVALTAPGRLPLRYGGLLQHIDVVTGVLHMLGVGRHERVALVLPQGPEMAVAFLAVASVATCAPLNPAYQANEFALYLTDLQAKAMIVQAGVDSPARAVAHSLAVPIIELTPMGDAAAGMFTLTGAATATHREAAGARPDDVALVLHTSGTTARPKIVPLTHRNLCRSAQNIARALELTNTDCCLNVMPLFHIHGLVGALLSSLAAGASVVCTPGFQARQFFAWQDAFHPTWYTAVPTMHQALLTWAGQHRESMHRAPLRFIRSCSAALPPSVASALEQVFKAPVIEAYGMTEAAHQIASNPLPPRQRQAGSVGLATGVEVAIMDAAGGFLPAGQTGEIVIRGAQVTSGYADNPEANAQAFVQGWLRTGDQGVMDAAGYLFLTGRLKEMINRGGEKIAPREIDEVLLQHPAVAQAVTFAMPHAQLGEEVAAAVVLHTPGSVTARALQEFVATHLAAFKVPRQIVLVEDLPKGATGKVQRLGLAEIFGLSKIDRLALPAPERARPDTHSTLVTRRDALDLQLTQIWEKVLGITPIGLQDNFFDLGGYSLLAVQVFDYIEQLYGKRLPLATLFQAPTLAQLAQVLRQEDWVAPWSSLVALQPGGAQPPLFCVHAHGGDVLFYRDLAAYLGAEQPFYALQAQGLDGTRPHHSSIPDMARHYVQEIRTLQLAGPYFLGGFCMGATIAFEMAQQLQAQGQDVALLAMLDAYAPGFRSTLPQRFAQPYKVMRRCQRLWHHLWNLALLEAPKRRAYITMRAQGMQTQVIRRLRRQLHRVAFLGSLRERSGNKHHVFTFPRAIHRAYVPQVFAGRITVFRPTWLPLGHAYDPTMGWGDLVVGGVDIYEVPGSHNALVFEPRVRGLAKLLRSCLAEAQAAVQVKTQRTDMPL